MDLKSLSDDELTRRLTVMAREERVSMRAFIEHLHEFDDRRLAGRTPHGTTFRYCIQELRLSESEAYRRLQVAVVIRRLPKLLDLLETGRLTLTAAGLLAPYLTQANFDALTGPCLGKGKREAELAAARYKTSPEARELVVWMGLCKPAAPQVPETLGLEASRKIDNGAATPTSPAPPANPSVGPKQGAGPAVPPASTATQQEATRTEEAVARLHFEVARAVFEKIERARALLRHKHPQGKLADVFDEALEALLDRIDRGRKPKPAPERPVLPGRRRIPEWVKDAVYARDRGRCAFQSVDGRRCETAEWLEFDHVRPFALGGLSDDPDNVRLLCRAHNQHRAREDFGDGEWSGGTF